MNIRWMISCDMVYILEIEKDNFPDPWSRECFHKILKNRNCIGKVYERDGKILGYLIQEWDKTTYNVVNLVIAKNSQRQGVAKELLSELIARMNKPYGKERILVSISDRNLVGQLFFRSLEFKAEKISYNFFGKDHHSYDFVLLKNKNLSLRQKDESCRGA